MIKKYRFAKTAILLALIIIVIMVSSGFSMMNEYSTEDMVPVFKNGIPFVPVCTGIVARGGLDGIDEGSRVSVLFRDGNIYFITYESRSGLLEERYVNISTVKVTGCSK